MQLLTAKDQDDALDTNLTDLPADLPHRERNLQNITFLGKKNPPFTEFNISSRHETKSSCFSNSQRAYLTLAANKFRQRLQAPDLTEICIQKKVGDPVQVPRDPVLCMHRGIPRMHEGSPACPKGSPVCTKGSSALHALRDPLHVLKDPMLCMYQGIPYMHQGIQCFACSKGPKDPLCALRDPVLCMHRGIPCMYQAIQCFACMQRSPACTEGSSALHAPRDPLHAPRAAVLCVHQGIPYRYPGIPYRYQGIPCTYR
ncbi:hypothetical protein Anapl_16029 [Anas platyrhynchos]|uniref:Uncharacterized protein n=1 Tax=Anas platyrhynchos TaxID=8839 RepID=R0L3V2_ANAPL|nr:hypothetical protein Anapl_16029 [Anas platyrhynchos]